ncbi:MAG: acetate/propionate family kinase [Novosphingobium sp.]|nr:acetate/propionate family kinase [Novosphingobium sp.]
MNNILVINAGSSSIKFALYDANLRESLAGNLSEIGGQSSLRLGDQTNTVQAQDHHAALRVILAELTGRGVTPSSLTAAGHRVVHGGRDLTAPCLINPNIIAAIESCFPLAPLHNPHNMVAIRALAELAPDLPQIACFDTAFHATNAEVALRYAIPAKEDALGIRRYGFHGISFQSLVANLPGLAGTPLPRRLLAFHLGNGASICAIRDGKSEATTMGYSPLDGLTMGTRSGSIDGNAVLRLAELYGLDGAARLLNRESGLVALAGTSDMRTISARDDADARFAIAHFCYWAIRHAGSMIAAMGGIDALAFTGGIGENDSRIRAAILDGLAWTGLAADKAGNAKAAPRLHAKGSSIRAYIVPAREERQIAAEALECLGLTGSNRTAPTKGDHA